MANDLGERRSVKQGSRQDMHGVEPATGLADVFDDEIGGVMRVEPLVVVEGVVHLGKGHRP